MNIGLVKARHAMWSIAIGSYLSDQSSLPEAVLVDAKKCALGQWLAEQQLASGKLTGDLAQLAEIHRDLHALGREIVGLKHRGDLNGARRLLLEVAPLSDRIVMLLDQIAAHSPALH